MINTNIGTILPERLLHNYFDTLVNSFFKILPIRENEESSLDVYMDSLMAEMLGCKSLISDLNYDSRFLKLVSILQYLIDTPDCPIHIVKREVFKAIRICNQLKDQYDKAV